MDASSAAETFEDLLHLGEMQIAFRENVWSQLPACAEAYDIAWLMYRITGDDVLTWALLAAGADEEDNPDSASTRAGIGRLNTMLLTSPIQGTTPKTSLSQFILRVTLMACQAILFDLADTLFSQPETKHRIADLRELQQMRLPILR